MLILTRKLNESIIIGDDIQVTVLEIQGDKVSLGVDAPKHITIHRKEIYQAIEEENRQAAQSVAGNWGKISQLLQKGQKGAKGGAGER